ncbi:hypothetical protein HAV15_009187 [Penicillium sp. str. |nr:hypothetical protein HAV15_009187 [Penicillium sp. str. \
MDPPTLALMKLHKLHPTLSASRTFILSVSYLLGTSYQYVTPQSKVENLGPVKLTRGQPRHPEEAEVHNFRLGSTEYIHEYEFYKVDDIRAPGYPFTWGRYPLSLEGFCVRDHDSQETLHPHLQVTIFNFDSPDEDSILASELSALVQIIGIRSRQPTFSGTPNIAALLISFFGARQVRVIQAFYFNGNWKDEEKEKDGEPKLTVTLEKAIELAGENKNKSEEPLKKQY